MLDLDLWEEQWLSVGSAFPGHWAATSQTHGQGGRRLLLGSLDRTQLLWLFHKHCPLMSSPLVLVAPFLHLSVGSRHHQFAAVPLLDRRMSTSFCAIPVCFMTLWICQNLLSTQLNTHKTSGLMISCLFLLWPTFAIVSHRNISFEFGILFT